MSVRIGTHSRARNVSARFAVAGVAALAAVVGTAPVAVADDDVAPVDNGTTETVDPAPSDSATVDPPPADEAPTEETPTGETPTDETPVEPVDQAPAEPSAPAEPTAQRLQRSAAADAAAAAIVPDFGYNKFRVGVKIADGSTVPAGVTTLGSTITIYETGPSIDNDEHTVSTTCTTTVDEGADGTFCDNLNSIGGGYPTAFYLARYGDTVTITQTTVNDGLTIIDGAKVVIPACNDQQDICEGGDNNSGDVLLTDAPLPVVDEPDPEPDPEPETQSDEAVLPDTGGTDAQLFALAMGLIGSGGWLVGKGRRPRRRTDAVV